MAGNRVRIIGGAWRSRLVPFREIEGLRPTPDRVRETLFNWLGQRLEGKICLDLFAGSGVLGFEALSRGASEVVMVEQNHLAVQMLRENAERLGAMRLAAQHLEVVPLDAVSYLRGGAKRFDVIFLDPPFRSGSLDRVLPMLAGRLAPDGSVFVESELAFEPGPGWIQSKSGRAGQVKFRLIKREEAR